MAGRGSLRLDMKKGPPAVRLRPFWEIECNGKKLHVPVQTTGPRKIIPKKEISVGGEGLVWRVHRSPLPEADRGVKIFFAFFFRKSLHGMLTGLEAGGFEQRKW
jgi:hypothetical protein